MKKLAMVYVDVFTERALTGNALAVCLDGRGLSTEQMQALARETNLSETTFILPGETAVQKERGIRVRIFTVQEELPFAGHPTLGTAFVLRGSGNSEVETVASFTNLTPSDFHDSVPIQTVSTGVPFAIAAVKSLEKLRNLRVDQHRAGEYLAQSGGKFFYFVSRETVDPKARLHARMLFYNGEDPATGSAAGCCASWMVAHGVAASDEHVMIEQGLEMHRSSRIFVRATKQDNQVINVRVGGNCVEVLRGELTLPD